MFPSSTCNKSTNANVKLELGTGDPYYYMLISLSKAIVKMELGSFSAISGCSLLLHASKSINANVKPELGSIWS